MAKMFAAIVLILGMAAGFLYYCNRQLKSELSVAKDKIVTLNSQVQGYEKEISKFNKAQSQAVETIEKVRTIIKTVKSDCDCYNQPLPDDIKQLLHRK